MSLLSIPGFKYPLGRRPPESPRRPDASPGYLPAYLNELEIRSGKVPKTVPG